MIAIRQSSQSMYICNLCMGSSPRYTCCTCICPCLGSPTVKSPINGNLRLRATPHHATPRNAVISHQSSVISYPSSVIRHQASVISHQSSVIIRHQSSSVISHHLSLVISHASPFHSLPLHSTPFHSLPLPSTPFHSLPLHSTHFIRTNELGE